MNRCATFAYRLIVPRSRHNNLEIVLSRKTRKRGKRGGIKIGKEQVRVKRKRKKKKSERENNSREKTMKNINEGGGEGAGRIHRV